MQSILNLQGTGAANSLSVRSKLEQLMCLKSDSFDVANSWLTLTELKESCKCLNTTVTVWLEEVFLEGSVSDEGSEASQQRKPRNGGIEDGRGETMGLGGEGGEMEAYGRMLADGVGSLQRDNPPCDQCLRWNNEAVRPVEDLRRVLGMSFAGAKLYSVAKVNRACFSVADSLMRTRRPLPKEEARHLNKGGLQASFKRTFILTL